MKNNIIESDRKQSEEMTDLLIFLCNDFYLKKFPDDEKTSKMTIKAVLERFEIAIIKVALVISSFNQAQAARMLGLNRTTLVMKMKKYKINKEQCKIFYMKTRGEYENMLGDER